MDGPNFANSATHFMSARLVRAVVCISSIWRRYTPVLAASVNTLRGFVAGGVGALSYVITGVDSPGWSAEEDSSSKASETGKFVGTSKYDFPQAR
jgi:hypothetical protein